MSFQDSSPQQNPSHPPSDKPFRVLIITVSIIFVFVLAGMAYMLYIMTNFHQSLLNLQSQVVSSPQDQSVSNTNASSLANVSPDLQKLTNETVAESPTDIRYVQTWNKNSAQSFQELYQVDPSAYLSSLRVFAATDVVTDTALKDQVYTIGVMGKEVIYKVQTEDSVETVYAYNKETKQSRKLFSLEKHHILYGGVFDEKSQLMYYTDQCGFFCVEPVDNATTIIRSYDFATNEERVLHQEKGTVQGFLAPASWQNATSMVLRPTYEGTEGPTYFPEIYFLNIQTKEITRFLLGDKVVSFAVAPDGQSVAFTTFSYDSVTKKTASSFGQKTLSGETKVFQTSESQEFKEVQWIEPDRLALLVTTIESVEQGLIDYPIGKKSIHIFGISAGKDDQLTVKSDPEDLVGAYSLGLYYIAHINTPVTPTSSAFQVSSYVLHHLELKDAIESSDLKDTVVLESTNSLRLFNNSLK